MIEPGSAKNQATAAEAGFVENARTLAASVVAYFAARLRLAGVESREAALHYLWVLLWLAGALLAALLGYLLLVAAAVFLVAHWTGWRWEWVLAAAAGVHFAAMLACVAALKGRLRIPVFSATLQEFKRDQEWLTSTKAQRQN